MASMKRSWKFQDFMAHNANVNCLALGHKSGRVLVTGGDDKKVNLWAVGKQSCFMSLSGHTTAVDCVQFNQLEELVCAGSRAGALKVWDLEAAKLVRTLNGHKYAIKCIDFHPYGDFLVSGSADSSIKMWDTRKKGVLFTYNGHKGTVNSVKFSPDGQWIATGGEDSILKIWDLRVSRVLKEFKDHMNPVTCVEFHPHEFLLASGSIDRSVNYFDLENFNLVSTESDVGAVRCLTFNPDGECLFAGTRDYLKIVGWEPNRLYDSVPVYWGRVTDVSVASNQLIGASFHLTNVQVYVVDLKKCKPFSSSSVLDSQTGPFTPNQNIRKSFSKAERPPSLKSRMLDVKTIEESTSGTDPEEESTADITNVKDYNEIFRVQRTPPPEPEPFQEPEKDDILEPQILGSIITESFEALSLDNDLNNYKNSNIQLNTNHYSRSKSNLDQVYENRQQRDNRENILPNINRSKPAAKFGLHRQSSCKDVPEKPPKPTSNIKHSVSEANINKGSLSSRASSRKNSFSKPSRNSTSVPNVSKVPNSNSARSSVVKSNTLPQVDIYVNSARVSPEEPTGGDDNVFVPVSIDRPVGLDMDDFLPKNYTSPGFQQQLPDMSEAEVLGVIMRGHDPIMDILNTRKRSLRLVLTQYRSKDMKTAVESAVAMGDVAVLVDLLGVINTKYSLWNLDLCVLVLPKILELLQSKYEAYLTVGCNTLKFILRHFGDTIRNNVHSPVGSFGVDISREERYQKSVRCHEFFTEIRSFVVKKQTLPGIGTSFKEIHKMIQTVFD
ncbi:katanin p80 WD40 repeat-containing subunit B1 isoform X2 [Diabrotica virgifera virgifera]|uniref:Katanin p80 WD40 repeat-containing subunit B1 n=1 Tax=Diabrotica virgifera virgifera TaxID=50390 RepID=A0ABM5JU36_DIAVI|nr:katanin p80 WD40 repeat-containing subunit B1 isoform X2 [Diabrotica virgifera virgifera]